MKNKITRFIEQKINKNMFLYLSSNVIFLNNQTELKKVFNWNKNPIISDPLYFQFDTIEDVNERRIRDAESIGTVVCNSNPSVILEIGTSDGHGTALIAENSPKADIFTVNITPEEIISGNGGTLTTVAIEREKIGLYYRQQNFKNIHQIYANTASWEPNIGSIDVSFIDGCHDADFVYNDTKKVLKHMKSGSFILWHDFNPELAEKYEWVHSVCEGVEWLLQDKLIQNRIFLVKDSWVGITQVP